jgi:antitoxin (DNA-binding transcriptional repressor) of toxin-antitoxin stability system
MQEVSITQLRQNLQAYIGKLRLHGRLRVTSRGKVVAEICPPTPSASRADEARARLRGSVLSYDDPTAPAWAPGEWEMNK